MRINSRITKELHESYGACQSARNSLRLQPHQLKTARQISDKIKRSPGLAAVLPVPDLVTTLKSRDTSAALSLCLDLLGRSLDWVARCEASGQNKPKHWHE